MRRALFLGSCLFLMGLLSGAAFGQDNRVDSPVPVEDGEARSIQQALLENRMVNAAQETDRHTRIAPDLNLQTLKPLIPTSRPAGIGYPLSNPTTETPKGKIYPSQSERDVVVGMLLTAALQKILP